jgi:hypothetical protein
MTGASNALKLGIRVAALMVLHEFSIGLKYNVFSPIA